jgi:hypothetical protein
MRWLSFMRRAATWWIIGLCLHGCWFFALLFWLSDSSLEQPIIDWVRRNRSPNQGGPDYVIAYGYILGALLWTFVAAILIWIFAGVLTWREARVEQRIKRGLCPACAYPIGASDVCTECGRALRSPSR